ncbi:MAG: TonB-dependent receptor [Algoriphagus sp.]|nr:TonB-dependent receptor [Algoriphagus sp.]
MKFIKIAILLFLSIGNQSAFAQVITVIDSESQQALPGVLIYSINPAISFTTSASGNANIGALSGSKNLMVQLLGYQSINLSWEELKAKDYVLELAPSPITLDIAVISASRWNQSSQDVAGKVRFLDPKLTNLRNPANSADWLGSSGEVFVQKSQLGGGSPMIRGFSANRLLYAVDGVRMNTAIFRSGNLQNVISLDPFAISKTEVLFGPGSVMYGSDAIGGAMVFETLSPETGNQSLRGNVLTRFSSAYSERTIHGDFSYGKGKWGFLSSVSYFDFGDLKMGSVNGQPNYLRPDYVKRISDSDQIQTNPNPKIQVGTGYHQLNLMQKIKFRSNEYTTWEYGFHYSTTGNIPRYDRLIERRDGKLRFARWDYGPQTWAMNTLKWSYNKPTRFFDQVKVVWAYQYFQESRIDRRVGNDTEFDRKEEVNAYSINADFLKNYGEERFLTYGFEGVINAVNSTGLARNIVNQTLANASARYPNAIWSSLAAYGSYHQQFTPKLKFQSALRYNLNGLTADFTNNREFYPLPFENSRNTYHSITGNVGLIYFPEPSFSIGPLISTGFRAPNVDDVGKIFDSEPGAVMVPNPNLRPEYAYNAEINLNKHVQNWLKVDFTGYYTLLDQAMVRRPFLLNGSSEIRYDGELSQVLAIQNAAFAEIKGIQAGLEIAFTKRLLFTSKYNWQRGIEELDDESTSPSRHAAPAFGMTRLSYLTQKLKVELTSLYSSEVPFSRMPMEERNKPALYAADANGNPYSPSWLIFNFQSSVQLSSFFQFNVGIENITDQQYRSYSSGIVAPGRNFTLSIKGSF